MTDTTSRTLINLQTAIEGNPIPTPEPMQGDKWLLASVLQKAIRRGDTAYALRAAYGLWLQDRQSFWRRLHIASVEDVGVANPELIVKTLTATSCSLWRRKVGDLRVGLFLTQKLCESDKTRIADEILIAAERSGTFSDVRSQFATADDELLTECITDESRPLTERCLAIWYLAGMRRYPSDLIPNRKGQPEDAAEVLRTLTAPPTLTESCIAVMSRTQWPLSIFTPIIWQEVEKHKESTAMRHNSLVAPSTVNGLPLYACDMFTRIGQTSFRKLQKAVTELKSFTPRQIGLGVFYREGGLLNKAMTSEFFEEFRVAGELADIECSGLPIPEYMALSEILTRNVPLLDDIRTQQLVRYFDGAETCAA